MVSRRNFAAITSMMLIVCFLFLLPQYVKNSTNPYGQNIYLTDEVPSGEGDVWRQEPLQSVADLKKTEDYILYIGAKEDAIGRAVTSWATFTKSTLAAFSTLPDGNRSDMGLPRMLILEAEACDFPKDAASLLAWNKKGVTIIFADLPSVDQIEASSGLRDLLGIRSVQQDLQELSAIRFFSGFLLGGERIYGTKTQRDREQMDLDLTAPWFRLTEETEVYVLGDVSEEVLPQQPYRNEQLPPLLWRRSLNGANVFAVNGAYFSGSVGIGILSAITAKARDYYLYPVVNSQVMTVANFPGMAEENTEVLTGRYGRDQVALNRDLLWPSLESISVGNDYFMSCFFMPQYDYSDETEPDAKLIPYYLKLMRECGAEAGISLEHTTEISLAEKWKKDMDYLSQDATGYRYGAAYLTEEELDEFRAAGDVSENLRSVCADVGEEEPLFFFLNERVLCQTVTHDLLDYSFFRDLELNSLQTALGYSNVLLDMKRVSWPEKDEPGWERYYETYASKLHTYWKRYNQFERLTVSQSDERIRRFLCMDYSESRSGDVISLQISPFQFGADFIVRTHMEAVSNVEGGSAVKLEEGAYLIHADRPEVKIQLEMNEQYKRQ